MDQANVWSVLLFISKSVYSANVRTSILIFKCDKIDYGSHSIDVFRLAQRMSFYESFNDCLILSKILWLILSKILWLIHSKILHLIRPLLNLTELPIDSNENHTKSNRGNGKKLWRASALPQKWPHGRYNPAKGTRHRKQNALEQMALRASDKLINTLPSCFSRTQFSMVSRMWATPTTSIIGFKHMLMHSVHITSYDDA